MANKHTHKEMFGFVIDALEGKEVEVSVEKLVDFVNGRIDALNKKSTNKKQTANQVENESLKVKIADVLAILGKATVTEIMKADADLGALSNQRVSAILRQMKENDGTVDKEVDKKKSYFFLIG